MDSPRICIQYSENVWDGDDMVHVVHCGTYSLRKSKKLLPWTTTSCVKGTVSLYSPGALLKIEIRHFDGPVFPYTLAHLVSIPHFI